MNESVSPSNSSALLIRASPSMTSISQSVRFRGDVLDLEHDSTRTMQLVSIALLLLYIFVGVSGFANSSA